jgi:hypothetical protein
MSPLEAKKYGIIDHVIGGDDAGYAIEGVHFSCSAAAAVPISLLFRHQRPRHQRRPRWPRDECRLCHGCAFQARRHALPSLQVFKLVCGTLLHFEHLLLIFVAGTTSCMYGSGNAGEVRAPMLRFLACYYFVCCVCVGASNAMALGISDRQCRAPRSVRALTVLHDPHSERPGLWGWRAVPAPTRRRAHMPLRAAPRDSASACVGAPCCSRGAPATCMRCGVCSLTLRPRGSCSAWCRRMALGCRSTEQESVTPKPEHSLCRRRRRSHTEAAGAGFVTHRARTCRRHHCLHQDPQDD